MQVHGLCSFEIDYWPLIFVCRDVCVCVCGVCVCVWRACVADNSIVSCTTDASNLSSFHLVSRTRLPTAKAVCQAGVLCELCHPL